MGLEARRPCVEQGAHPRRFQGTPIYCDTYYAPDDLFYSGSEDEYYETPAQRKSRYETEALRFLEGRRTLLISTSLKGPFSLSSGWTNPWAGRQQHRQRKTIQMQGFERAAEDKAFSIPAVAESTGQLANDIPVTDASPAIHTQVAEESFDYPPGEDLRKHPVRTSTRNSIDRPPAVNSYLDGDTFARVKGWRDTVDPGPAARDDFWAPVDKGVSRSQKQKRTAPGLWLKTLVKKRKAEANEPIERAFTISLSVERHSNCVPKPPIPEDVIDELTVNNQESSLRTPKAVAESKKSHSPLGSQKRRIVSPIQISSQDSNALDELSGLDGDLSFKPMLDVSRSDGSIRTIRSSSHELCASGGDGPDLSGFSVSQTGNDSFETDLNASKQSPQGLRKRKRPHSGTTRRSLRSMDVLQDEPKSSALDNRISVQRYSLDEDESQHDASFHYRLKPQLQAPSRPSRYDNNNRRSSQTGLLVAKAGYPEHTASIKTRLVDTLQYSKRKLRQAEHEAETKGSLEGPTALPLDTPHPDNYATIKGVASCRTEIHQSNPAGKSQLDSPRKQRKLSKHPGQKASKIKTDPNGFAVVEPGLAPSTPTKDRSAALKRKRHKRPKTTNPEESSTSRQREHSHQTEFNTIVLRSGNDDGLQDLRAVEHQLAMNSPQSRKFVDGDTTLLSDNGSVPQYIEDAIATKAMNLTPPAEDRSEESSIPSISSSQFCCHGAEEQASSMRDKMEETTRTRPRSESSAKSEAVVTNMASSNGHDGLFSNRSTSPMNTPRLATQDQSPWMKTGAAGLRLPDIRPEINAHEGPRRSQNLWPTHISLPSWDQCTAGSFDIPTANTELSLSQNPWAPIHTNSRIPSTLQPASSCSPHIQGDGDMEPQARDTDATVLCIAGNVQPPSSNPAKPSTPDTKHSSLPTPDFTVSIKSFRRFRSPSPDVSHQTSMEGVLESTLSNPWARSSPHRKDPDRHVRFDIPDTPDDSSGEVGVVISDLNEEDFIEAGLPKRKSRRTIRQPEVIATRPTSPPPSKEKLTGVLPVEVEKFQNHYAAVSRRPFRRHPHMQPRLLPSASQQVLSSPAAGAMAERFIEADKHAGLNKSPLRSILASRDDKENCGETQQSIDDVSHVLDNLDSFLDVWDTPEVHGAMSI